MHSLTLTKFDQDLYDRCRREEGYEDGVADGARDAKLETARNLLNMGVLTTEQIAQSTGLAAEEIATLK